MLSFTTTVGTPSAQQTYTVKGNGLTHEVILITSPGFSISTVSGGPYTNEVVLTPGQVNAAPVPIYVIFNPTASGTVSGGILHNSGAYSDTLTLQGTATNSGSTTRIYDIQGTGTASPVVGTTVTTEGIVTADFQGASQLGGFFIFFVILTKQNWLAINGCF